MQVCFFVLIVLLVLRDLLQVSDCFEGFSTSFSIYAKLTETGVS